MSSRHPRDPKQKSLELMVQLAVLDLIDHEDSQGFVLPMAEDDVPPRFITVGTRTQIRRWLDEEPDNDEQAAPPQRIVDLGKRARH
jgi:hypothetical protein